MATKRREKHTQELCANKEVTFYSVYVGSIKVDRSMRTMQYELRTAVTKEAIVKVCSASAATCKLDIKRPKGIRQINKILNHSPEVVRLGVNFTVSLLGLKSYRTDENRVILNHSMSAISFASCGDPPFKSFVGYVAKDPVLGRACHVFNCFGDAYDVVSTIGEAFSIKYDDVMNKHSQSKPSFEFIEVNEGFFSTIFDDDENTANNRQLGSDSNILRSRSENNIARLYENIPKTPRQQHSNSLLPRVVGDSVFYVPPVDDKNAWPRTDYCPSPPASPKIGGRCKKGTKDDSKKTDTASAPANEGPPPTKPPRPKAPVYANIGEVERQTRAETSEERQTRAETSEDAAGDESVRVTPEELRKNLEELECSLDEISASKQEPHPDTANPYDKMSWFHGKICREESERRLKYQGDYLVRSHGNGQFVLSCMDSGFVRHLLLVDPNGQIRTRDRKFVSITDLVTHYATSGECIVSEGCALRIIRPVPQTPT